MSELIIAAVRTGNEFSCLHCLDRAERQYVEEQQRRINDGLPIHSGDLDMVFVEELDGNDFCGRCLGTLLDIHNGL